MRIDEDVATDVVTYEVLSRIDQGIAGERLPVTAKVRTTADIDKCRLAHKVGESFLGILQQFA